MLQGRENELHCQIRRAPELRVHQLTYSLSHAGVFFPLVISPEVTALSMSGSSSLVAVNAQLLKRTRLEGIRQAADTHSSGELTAERMGA